MKGLIIIVCCFVVGNCVYPSLILQDQIAIDNYVYIKHCILSSYDYKVPDNFNDVSLIWFYVTKYNLTNAIINFSIAYNIKSCLSNHVYSNETNYLINKSLNIVAENNCINCNIYIYMFLCISIIYLMLIAYIMFKM